MAGPTLSRFLGLFRLRDATDPTRVASVGADGKVATSDTTLATRLGEVQASPTANTVLDRLKALGTLLSGTLAVAPPATIRVSVSLTVGATLHALGDAVGGKISFANAVRVSGGGGTIQTVIVRDKAAQASSYDLILFNADPAAATITDDAPFVFSTDLSKCIGHIPVGEISAGTQGVLTASGVGHQFKLASGTTLYAALVARGAPTFASTSDVEVEIVVIPD